MGLHPKSQDPCVFSRFVRDPDNVSDNPFPVSLTMGLYIDDFVHAGSRLLFLLPPVEALLDPPPRDVKEDCPCGCEPWPAHLWLNV